MQTTINLYDGSPNVHQTQRQRILSLLMANEWVSSKVIARLGLQYNARIHELRHNFNHVIENKWLPGIGSGYELIKR